MGKEVKNPYVKASDWGWQIDPVGLRYMLNVISERYELPMMIVENGIGLHEYPDETGVVQDDTRIKYFSEHIAEMKKAVDEMVLHSWDIVLGDLLTSYQQVQVKWKKDMDLFM